MAFSRPYDDETTTLIRRRRGQMLVHCYIYYELNDNIIDDHTWQQWANELEFLQFEYPEPIGYFDEAFKDWSGASGFQLKAWYSPRIIQVAEQLVANHHKQRSEQLEILDI